MLSYSLEWEHHDHAVGFASHGPAADVLSNQTKVADQKKSVHVAFQSLHGDEGHQKIWKAPVTAIIYANVKPGVSVADFEKGIQASKSVADGGANGLVSFDAGPVVGNPNEWVVAAGYSSLEVSTFEIFNKSYLLIILLRLLSRLRTRLRAHLWIKLPT